VVKCILANVPRKEDSGTVASKTCLQFLEALENLPPNWDSYGSIPPTPQALRGAEGLLRLLTVEAFPSPQVVPVPGGGVQLEWQVGPRGLEVEIRPDGSIEYLKVEGEFMEEGPLLANQPDRLRELVRWLTAQGQ
jgi:hypothetical protein